MREGTPHYPVQTSAPSKTPPRTSARPPTRTPLSRRSAGSNRALVSAGKAQGLGLGAVVNAGRVVPRVESRRGTGQSAHWWSTPAAGGRRGRPRSIAVLNYPSFRRPRTFTPFSPLVINSLNSHITHQALVAVSQILGSNPTFP